MKLTRTAVLTELGEAKEKLIDRMSEGLTQEWEKRLFGQTAELISTYQTKVTRQTDSDESLVEKDLVAEAAHHLYECAFVMQTTGGKRFAPQVSSLRYRAGRLAKAL